MINAWSLLDSEINGTMDEDYPIMSEKEKDVTVLGGATNEDEPTFYNEKHSPYYYEYDRNDSNRENPFVDFGPPADVGTLNLGTLSAPAGEDTLNFSVGNTGLYGGLGEDHFAITGTGMTAWDDPKYYASAVDFAVDSMGSSTKPQPELKYKAQKYQEDKGIKDLKDYVSSTYRGHYTSKNNNVQTLDLIQSVGDAEAFCRSNAIKYLSRYDKRGQAKRDILKAMHYCLLLYYFSGQTNEDLTQHGYETF